MLSLAADRGCVESVNVKEFSPATFVGVHSGGDVPIVQNSKTRLGRFVGAASARSERRNGDSSRPAPTLVVNCRRLTEGMGIRSPLTLLLMLRALMSRLAA